MILCLKTYENLRFWTIEELKSKTVLILCLKTYENLRFWKIEELKSLTVLLSCLKTYENLQFWKVEEHHSHVLGSRGHDVIVFYIQSDLSRIQKMWSAVRIWGGPLYYIYYIPTHLPTLATLAT